MIEKAYLFAKLKHKNQKRKFSNRPYIVHPENVALRLSSLTDSPDVICAAYLHDTLEDTDTSYEELAEIFNKKIADLVLELTNNKEEIKIQGKDRYLAGKLNAMSGEALLIKLADMLDNLLSLKETSDEFRNKFINDTIYMINYLKRSLSLEQSALLAKIKKLLKI